MGGAERLQGARGRGWGGGWHRASVSDCSPLAAPIGLSPLLILTLCGPERVLVVSTEPQSCGASTKPPEASRSNISAQGTDRALCAYG